MTKDPLTIADYPLAEVRPDLVRGARGKNLDEITLDSVLKGATTLEDLRITANALRQQSEIARAAGRPTLSANFERAAELVGVPQDLIMRVYELLRPGRAKGKDEMFEVANDLKTNYGADEIAAFVKEAAEVYESRGLFNKRY